MITKIAQTIKKHALISDNERVLIALSGGADSVALLHALKALGYDLCAAHINHMIRGEEALRDEWFTVDLCRGLGVPLMIYKKNCPQYAMLNKLTLEEAARKLRYEALENAKETFGADKIATAHTENDNLETMLMRLIRGSSAYGLRGIDVKKGYIVRPLLDVNREEIEDYAREHALLYVEDSTNTDTTYFRNRVRRLLLPELESFYNPNVRAALSRLSVNLKMDADYFEQEIRKSFDKYADVTGDAIVISAKAKNLLHPAVFTRLIRYSVARLAGDDKDFDQVHTMMVSDLFEKESGKKISLTKGIAAANSFGDVAIYKERPPVREEVRLSDGDFVEFFDMGEYVSFTSAKPGGKENFINTCTYEIICDKMIDSILIRTRRDGDVIMKSPGKTMKLKDFLIERRVPVYMRDHIYVVAHDNVVFAILSPVGKEIYAAFPNTEAGQRLFIALWRKNEREN